MPNLSKATITATGVSTPIALDWTAAPFAATVQVVLTGGTTSYGLETTLDDLQTTPAASVRWVPSAAPDLPSGTTTGGTVRYSTPVAAVRLNVASLSGGNLELRVLQS